MSPQRRPSADSVPADPAPLSSDPTSGPWSCCSPKGCIFAGSSSSSSSLTQISREELGDAVRVVCSSETCAQSPFMHAACFEAFEDGVLQFLRANGGRAKAWSEKQRTHNLWTKRGYDLIYKACDCACGHGHIRKDLDWAPAASANDEVEADAAGAAAAAGGSKRKRKKSKSQSQGGKNTITIGLPMFGSGGASQSGVRRSDAQSVPRNRTSSLSSSGSGGSSVHSGSPAEFSSASPGSMEGMGGAMGVAAGAAGATCQPPRRAILQDRSRHDSGGSIFQRRLDYSSFNALPRHKINSYHIKMEDECSIGNDETRIFILSNLASNKMNRVPCVGCNGVLTIFDRYPLIDGTFFLSPRQHNKNCIQVKSEGKHSFLTAVCMGCLEGWTTTLFCRYCLKPWTGSHLILGTMYSYDIFAATPCCAERLKCNTCNSMVIHPDQRFSFFSDYSQMVSCPACGAQDAHFVKSLAVFVKREEAQRMAAAAQQNPGLAGLAGLAAGMRVHRVNSA